jgi:glycosyltransferase involved in cell wall biosynthesis
VVDLAKAAVSTARYARELSSNLGEIGPDIIHSNGLKMHLLGAWARPRGTPLVWHIHDYVGLRPLMRRLLRPFRGSCATAIVNSNSVAADLERALPGLRIVPIYNAIDPRRFSPQGTSIDLDAEAGLAPPEPGTIRVGLIATFARWKGHEVFLQALARLPGSLAVRGYIVGGAIYQTPGSQWTLDELRQRAEQFGLNGRVGFTGFIEDSAAAMRSLDIVVHASTQPEPFGMVIIEGMACGKPVIASQSGGAAELFTDGENALAHAPGDVDGLARQIERLARDPRLRAELGEAGRTTVERHYQGKRLAAELLNVYRNVAVDASGKAAAGLASPLSATGK